MRFFTPGSMWRRALIGAAVALLGCSIAYPQEKPVPPEKQPAPAQPPAPEKPLAQEKAIVPASAERHFHQGVAFEKDGNAENAIDEYKTAIKEYPD